MRDRAWADFASNRLLTFFPLLIFSCFRVVVAWRYFAFHPLGEMLLLADSSVAFSTPDEFASASVIGYPRPSLKLVILDIADVTRQTKKANAMDDSACASSPSVVQGKQELRVLATLDRLLFFSDSGVALHDSKLATCQWNSPSDLACAATAGLSALVPSLVIFSLHPSSLGVPLVRVALDQSSFADLTCVCFTDESAEFLAVAFQVSRSRRERRERIKHMQRLQDAMWPARAAAETAASAVPAVSAADAPPAGAFPPPRRLRAGRSSALSRLTESENAESSSAIAAPSSSEPNQGVVAASTSRVDELLEERTFLSVYRSSDLLRVQQYCAPLAEVSPLGVAAAAVVGSGSSVLSSNVLLSHPCRSVGFLSGSTNGDIHVFSPVALDRSSPADLAPACAVGRLHAPSGPLVAAVAVEDVAEVAAPGRVVPLHGRHRLPSDLR